jgi:alpha-L-fucosidase 2
MIREILKYCEPKDQGAGGTYPNFFDAHPPFQIDGNFGATAGYIEMLLQSHLNELHLLPALPSTWSSGRVSGLKGRGNFEVDLTWKDKKITNGKITSFMGNHCRLRSLTALAIEGAEVQSSHEGIYFIYSFKTEKGGEYHLSAYTN